MNWLMLLFTALLFVVLTPGVLVKLPPKGKPLLVAVVHGLLFALLYSLVNETVWQWTMYDGFANPAAAASACRANKDCPTGNVCTAATPVIKGQKTLNKCVPAKSLPVGSFCAGSQVCVNGCNVDTNKCL